MQSPKPLEAKYHPPAQPEYHTVSNDELCRIEENCGRPSTHLGWMTLSLSAFTGFFVPLLPENITPNTRDLLFALATIFGFLSVNRFWKWYQTRNDGPRVIKTIRKRAKTSERKKDDPILS